MQAPQWPPQWWFAQLDAKEEEADLPCEELDCGEVRGEGQYSYVCSKPTEAGKSRRYDRELREYADGSKVNESSRTEVVKAQKQLERERLKHQKRAQKKDRYAPARRSKIKDDPWEAGADEADANKQVTSDFPPDDPKVVEADRAKARKEAETDAYAKLAQQVEESAESSTSPCRPHCPECFVAAVYVTSNRAAIERPDGTYSITVSIYYDIVMGCIGL